MQRIKKGDHVIVTTGKNKGQRGDVISVAGDRVFVSNVNLVKRHTKGNPQDPAGSQWNHRARSLDPHFQRDAVQPRHQQG